MPVVTRSMQKLTNTCSKEHAAPEPVHKLVPEPVQVSKQEHPCLSLILSETLTKLVDPRHSNVHRTLTFIDALKTHFINNMHPPSSRVSTNIEIINSHIVLVTKSHMFIRFSLPLLLSTAPLSWFAFAVLMTLFQAKIDVVNSLASSENKQQFIHGMRLLLPVVHSKIQAVDMRNIESRKLVETIKYIYNERSTQLNMKSHVVRKLLTYTMHLCPDSFVQAKEMAEKHADEKTIKWLSLWG